MRWLISLLVCALFFFSPTVAQEKVKKTETIATTIKVLPGQLSTDKPVEIPVSLTYTLTSANEDSTLSGNLSFLFTEKERKKIAEATGKPLTEIPASLAQQNISATFAKHTHCPEIQLGFSELDVAVAGTKLHLNRFVLSIRETPARIARGLCIWTDRANKGNNNKGIVQFINLLLKGEEDEEQPK